MATQDEKISNNRRRLFKALSAAPVVATLRPGEALAALSSYQCAANIRDELTLETGPVSLSPKGPDDLCFTGPDEFCYEPRVYWSFSAPLPLDDGSGDPVPTTGVDVTAPFKVVYAMPYPDDVTTVTATTTAGVFVLLDEGGGSLDSDGDDFPSQLGSGASFEIIDGTMTIRNSDGVPCYAATPTLGQGLAVVGYSSAVDGVDDRLFTIEGVYPEGDARDVVVANAQHGDLQGITGTCLTSIPYVASVKRQTLTIG